MFFCPSGVENEGPTLVGAKRHNPLVLIKDGLVAGYLASELELEQGRGWLVPVPCPLQTAKVTAINLEPGGRIHTGLMTANKHPEANWVFGEGSVGEKYICFPPASLEIGGMHVWIEGSENAT